MDQSSYFIDTSALFKRYVEEAGSLTINRLLDSGATCYVSLATLIEVVSNLRRLVDVDKLLTDEEFNLVKEVFLGEIGNGTLQTVAITSWIILTSLEICSNKYVTPLDAIQLSSALSLGKETIFFVCSDSKLLKLAVDCGLRTFNPVKQD